MTKADKRPLLSFAIPTYNFGRFIAETVKSIENGAEMLEPSQFEIVILDGGSNDNTEEVVRSLVELYQNIRYIKQSERGGIDRDMNTAVGLACGKYIWLFSADDVLVCGWDRYIVPLLNRGGDIFLVPAILSDIGMKPIRKNPIFKDCTGKEPIEFDISPENDSLDNYLNHVATLEALFSFMGAVLVDSNAWRALPAREDYFGSCWAHCARLMPIFLNRTKIIYLNRFLTKKRLWNDSFLIDGFVARIAISIDGWDRIIREFFVNASHRQMLYGILRKDMPILLFIYAKISAQNTYDIEHLNAMARLLYAEQITSPVTRINYLLYRLIPASAALNAIIKPLLPALKHIRHKMKSLFS
jgi:abequosyltransferase